MATLVNGLTADFTTVLCHFKSEVALAAAVTVAFLVLVDYPKWLAAYPDVVAEKFDSLHFFFLLKMISMGSGSESGAMSGNSSVSRR